MHKGKFKKLRLRKNECSLWHTEYYMHAKKIVIDVH
jgi:hypothetical protein